MYLFFKPTEEYFVEILQAMDNQSLTPYLQILK